MEQSIMAVIKERHSVRTYEDAPLPIDLKEKLRTYLNAINESEGVFGGKIRVDLIEKSEVEKEVKLGTYGVIKGAQAFLAVAANTGDYALEDLGYLFEKVVLFCTSIGLGTVWLGGTFNKGHFARAMQLRAGETLPIISPVGIESSQKSLIAKLFGVNTNKRLDFGQLFFDGDFKRPLTPEKAMDLGEVLEMVRLAPSAMNKQPWRILKGKDALHIYSDGKIDMSRVDMGICLCHLALAAEEKGIGGTFKVMKPELDAPYKYLVSWVMA